MTNQEPWKYWLTKLNETGELESIQSRLRTQLSQSGWKDRYSAHVESWLDDNWKDQDPPKIEDILTATSSYAKDTIPEAVKADLLKNIKNIILQELSKH